MFCVNCGKELANATKFCPHCGQAVAPTTNKATPSTQKRSRGLGMALLLISLLGFGIGVWYYLQIGFEDEDYRQTYTGRSAYPLSVDSRSDEEPAPRTNRADFPFANQPPELRAAKQQYDVAFEHYTAISTGSKDGDIHQALREFKQAYANYQQIKADLPKAPPSPVESSPAKSPPELDVTGINGIVDIEDSASNGLADLAENPSSPPSQSRTFVATPALDSSPLAGIRIQAAANALDKPRQFHATPLDSTQLDDLYQQHWHSGLIPLGGVDLDSKMAANARFRRPIQLQFDLAKLDVAEVLHPHVHLAQLDSKGQLHLLQSQRQANVLHTDIRHNNIFLYVLFGTTVAAGQHYGVFDKELKEYPDGWQKGAYQGLAWPPKQPHYTIHYPKKWQTVPTQAYQDLQQQFTALHKQYGFNKATNRYQAQGIMEAMLKDPAYQKLQATATDPQWLLKHYLPTRTANVVRAMDMAVDYMAERKLRKPGAAGVAWLTDIYIQATSLGKELYGEARNGWTTRAFIVIDGTKVPDVTPQQMSATQRQQYDALKTTTLHEYFHIVQSAYTFIERISQLWFAEATAVQFEAEAGKAYLAKQQAQSWDYTTRPYQSFAERLDLREGMEKSLQQHGYGAAYFLDFLRDKYYRNKPDAFLPDLLEDFSSVRSGPLQSLANVTSGELATLAEDYRNFARRIRTEMINSAEAPRLSPKKPYYAWQLPSDAALSAPALRVKLQGQDFINYQGSGSKVVLRDSSGFIAATDVMWSTDRKDWQRLQAGIPFAFELPNIEVGRSVYILMQRIAAYVDAHAAGVGKGPASTDVYLLLAPSKAPQAETQKGQLRLKIPASALMRAKAAAGMGPYLQGVQIRLQNAKDDQAAKVWLPHPKTSVELSVAKIVSRLTDAKANSVKTRIQFRECAHRGQKVYGPWSPAVELELQAQISNDGGVLHWIKPALSKAKIKELWETYGNKQALKLRIEINYRNGQPSTIYRTDYDLSKGLDVRIPDVDIANINNVVEYTIGKTTGKESGNIYMQSGNPKWDQLMAGETLQAGWVYFSYKANPQGGVLTIRETLEEPPKPERPPPGSGGRGNPMGDIQF